MTAAAPDKPLRSRKSADARMADLIAAADRIVNQTRSADLSLQQVVDEVGISRALVYAYFPDRFRLLDAVLAGHVARLEEAGLSRAAANGRLEERVRACARIVLHHILDHGATLELVMRDQDVARQLDGTTLRYLRRIVLVLARQAAIEMRMGGAEAMAFVELLAVIPLEAARRVQADAVRVEIAESVCDRLVRSSIAAQVPQTAA